MTDRVVRIVISGTAAEALRMLRDTEGALGRVGQAGTRAGAQTRSFGDTLREGLQLAGVTTGLAGVALGIKNLLTSGMAFEDNMNSLRAVSGATATQMAAVSARARELGSDMDLPATSASDAAEAMLELSKGGLTVQQSMSAAKGTLLLAAAAQVSGAQAAEIQSSALNAFSLEADQANRVADILANTANAASGEITDFAQGLQQSAAVAHSFGIDIDDTSTVLGLFANAGIKGSDAGTSFKTMLTSLASPTKQQAAAMADLNLTVYDAQGSFVGMRSITEQLTAAKGTLTQAEYNAAASIVFGSDAIRGANILAEGGVAAWDNMNGAVNRAGGAQEVAAAKTEGLSGAIGTFMSKVEDVSLSLYTKLSPALQDVVGFATTLIGAVGDMVGWFTDLPGPIQAGGLALAGVVLLRGPLVGMFLALRQELVMATYGMGVFSASAHRARIAALGVAGAARGALGLVGGPFGLAIMAGVTALSFWAGSSDDAAAATADFTGAVDENTGALSENAAEVVAAASKDAIAKYQELGGATGDYTAALLGNVEAQDRVHTAILDAAEAAVIQTGAFEKAKKDGAANTDNARQFASAQLAAGESIRYSSTALGEARQLNADFAAAQGALGTVTADTTAKLNEAGAANQTLAGSTSDAGKKAADAAPSLEGLKTATEALGGAASFTDAAVQFLSLSLDQMAGKAISAEQATRANDAAFRAIGTSARDYQAAQDGVTEADLKVIEATQKLDEAVANLGKSQKDGGTTAEDVTAAQLDLNDANRAVEESSNKVADATDAQFEANIKARDTALLLASSAYQTAVANGNLAGAASAANAVIETQRARFIAAQSAADQESGAAVNLAAKLFGIPGAVGTAITETGGQKVIDTAGRVKYSIDQIPGFKSVLISVTGNYDPAVQAARNAGGFTGGKVGSLPGFAFGGKVPRYTGGGKLWGTPPSNPRVDNLLAVGPSGRAVKLRSKEWIINQQAAEHYGDTMMAAINSRTFIPQIPPQRAAASYSTNYNSGPQGGTHINIENISALSPGAVIREMDLAVARLR